MCSRARDMPGGIFAVAEKRRKNRCREKGSFHSFHFANAFTATSCSHVTAWSSAEWRRTMTPSENLVCGHDSTMYVTHCLYLTTLTLVRCGHPYAICEGWLHNGPGQCETDSAVTMSSDEASDDVHFLWEPSRRKCRLYLYCSNLRCYWFYPAPAHWHFIIVPVFLRTTSLPLHHTVRYFPNGTCTISGRWRWRWGRNLRAGWWDRRWGNCYTQKMTANQLSTWKWRQLGEGWINIIFSH